MKISKEPKAKMVLKAFLGRCEPQKKRELVQFLPENEREEVEKLPDFSHEIKLEHFANGSVLEKVHWSWFLPTLKTYPETDQKLFLLALSPSDAKNLSKALLLSPNGQEMSEAGRSFLRKTLFDSLVGPADRLLPREYLPPGPLNRLLDLSKKELTRVINLLSLHDLAAEVRQIVETKTLKKLYSLLSEEERRHLKEMTAHKESFSLGRLGIERWDGSEESLRTLLHKRGLARFGTGLSGQDPDFVWYICHQLDIGRGNALYKLCAKEPIHGMTDGITRQIEELL